jgi:phage gpG-like protein
MYLDVEVSGDEKVQSHFSALVRRLEHPAPVMETKVVDFYQRRQRQRFASRGGGSWPANRPGTVRQKGNGRVGIDSGSLFRSLTSSSRGSVARVSGDTLTFGTSLFTAHFFKKRHPLFNMRGADAKHVSSIVLQFLLEPFDG